MILGAHHLVLNPKNTMSEEEISKLKLLEAKEGALKGRKSYERTIVQYTDLLGLDF
jgi:hypothetical protein